MSCCYNTDLNVDHIDGDGDDDDDKLIFSVSYCWWHMNIFNV